MSDMDPLKKTENMASLMELLRTNVSISKDVQTLTKIVEKHENVIEGTGDSDPGIKSNVRTLMTWMKEHIWWRRAVLLALATLLIERAYSIFLKGAH